VEIVSHITWIHDRDPGIYVTTSHLNEFELNVLNVPLCTASLTILLLVFAVSSQFTVHYCILSKQHTSVFETR
jgi:hypothetical protein